MREGINAMHQRAFVDDLIAKELLIQDTLPTFIAFDDTTIERLSGFVIDDMEGYIFHCNFT